MGSCEFGVEIIRTLDHSIETGSFVKLNLPDRPQRPSADQTIKRPPVEQQLNLIDA
jgi:glucose-fructose oxidoreductase